MSTAPSVTVRIELSREVYDLEAIKRAAYRFTNRLSVEIEPSEGVVVCILRPKAEKRDLTALEAEFRNEVLDQDLRIRIGRETEPVRNLILSLAFSKTGLQE